VEEEEGPCQSLPEACSGEHILALERDDDPSSKNGEGERQCKVMGNSSTGTGGYLVHVHAKDTLTILIIKKLDEGKSELNRTAAKVAGRKTIVK
jgi:hypothetical protein